MSSCHCNVQDALRVKAEHNITFVPQGWQDDRYRKENKPNLIDYGCVEVISRVPISRLVHTVTISALIVVPRRKSPFFGQVQRRAQAQAVAFFGGVLATTLHTIGPN